MQYSAFSTTPFVFTYLNELEVTLIFCFELFVMLIKKYWSV